MLLTRILEIVLLFGGCSFLQASLNSPDLQALLANCPDPLPVRICCFRRKFRSFDGSCNNLCNTMQGAAFRPFPRLIPPAFDNGNQPRSRAVDGSPLPNARRISRQVFNNTNENVFGRPRFTHMTMTWGQFLDHDLTLTEANETLDCGVNNEPCPQREGCIGITILRDDELLRNRGAQCIPLGRSAIKEGQQINIIPPYMDASQVYGPSRVEADRLRDRKSKIGLLDVRALPVSSDDMLILPKADEETFCRSTKPAIKPCFLAGDFRRVNENQALSAMHTIWVREHNRIAYHLHFLNPTWHDERLFQEARKIVIAEIQHITFNEFLTALFDPPVLKREGILLEEDTFFSGYDSSINAEVSNSFAASAFRMGHSLIRNQFVQLNKDNEEFGSIPVRDFFNPAPLYQGGIQENGIGGILLGLINRTARGVDSNFATAVRERLIIEGPTSAGITGDLTAINIQRGRDHGLPPYVIFRKFCNLGKPLTFSDLAADKRITPEQTARLEKAYTNVIDIDLFAGAMSEIPEPGSAMGPTFTCLLGNQFKKLRSGDRFWYERDDPTIGFTLEQLSEIRKATLAKVICDNADNVKKVQKQVFISPSQGSSNPTVHCDDLQFVNLNVFKDGASCKEQEEVVEK